MSTEIAIIEIPREKALEVFTTKNGLDPYLKQIVEQAKQFVPDTSTRKGRDEIASVAYKVAKSKTALDKVGKESVESLKLKTKLVDAERKRMREFLDSLKDEVRQPLTEWEQAEEDRKRRHTDNVEHLVSMRDIRDDSTSEHIAAIIESVQAIAVDESYEEYEAEAHREKARTLEALNVSLERRKQYEAEQAELARLRAEAEERRIKEEQERITREAVERAEREAAEREAKAKAEREAKEKAEREAAERRELELKHAAEKAERERLEAIDAQRRAEEKARQDAIEAEQRAKQAAIDTENRLKAEAEAKAQAEAAELAKREANKKHAAKIHNGILKAIMVSGISEKQGKEIISLIAKGQVPNLKINY